MRARPTHATVVAYLALFIALGGSAYAVSAGSIGTRELRDNDVRGKDIRSRTVRDRDVNQRTLAYAKPYIVYEFKPSFPPLAGRNVQALCKRGDVALSGGTDEQLDRATGSVTIARPINSRGVPELRDGSKPVGWTVIGATPPDPSRNGLAAYAVCLPVARR